MDLSGLKSEFEQLKGWKDVFQEGRGRLKGTFIFKIKLGFQLLFFPVGRFTASY